VKPVAIITGTPGNDPLRPRKRSKVYSRQCNEDSRQRAVRLDAILILLFPPLYKAMLGLHHLSPDFSEVR
jgi:hypothetical protein